MIGRICLAIYDIITALQVIFNYFIRFNLSLTSIVLKFTAKEVLLRLILREFSNTAGSPVCHWR
jgi:hypothetical protein